MDNIKSIRKETKMIPLEKQYDSIMTGVSSDFLEKYSEWEKQGDNYRKFSLYESNKYETTTSSSINIKNNSL